MVENRSAWPGNAECGQDFILKILKCFLGDLPLANARAVNEPIEFPENTWVRLINFGFCLANLFNSCKLKAPKVPPPSKVIIRYFAKADVSFLHTFSI